MGKSRKNPNVEVEASPTSVPTLKAAKKEKRGAEEKASEERARSKKQKVEIEHLDQDKKKVKKLKKTLIEPPWENKNEGKSSDFECGVEASLTSVPTLKAAKKEKRGTEEKTSEEQARSKKQKVEIEHLDQDKKKVKKLKKTLIEPPWENKNEDKSSDFECGVEASPTSVPTLKAAKKEKRGTEEKASEERARSKKQKVEIEHLDQDKKKVKKLKKTFTEPPWDNKNEGKSSDFECGKSYAPKTKLVKMKPELNVGFIKNDSDEEDGKSVPKPKASIAISKKKADYSDSSSESDSGEEIKKLFTTIFSKNTSDFSDSSSESDSDAEDVRTHFSIQKTAASAPKSKPESSDISSHFYSDKAKKETGDKRKDSLPDDAKNHKISKLSDKVLETPAEQNEESDTKRLFVGNLSEEVIKDDLLEFFKKYGEVTEVRLAIKEDGSFRGFGHVEFATKAGARAALRMNGHMLLGRPMIIDLAREMGSNNPNEGEEKRSYKIVAQDPGHSIYVKGFSKSIEEDQIRKLLNEHFGSYGEIIRVSIPQDNKTRRSKGFAYVLFNDQDTASKALELNGTELGGYTLTVQQPTPKSDSRNGSYSGGRGRGGRLAGQGGGHDRGCWGRGRGGRGPGASYNRSATMANKGKKTTFEDNQ